MIGVARCVFGTAFGLIGGRHVFAAVHLRVGLHVLAAIHLVVLPKPTLSMADMLGVRVSGLRKRGGGCRGQGRSDEKRNHASSPEFEDLRFEVSGLFRGRRRDFGMKAVQPKH
jgi:hypothetical protein